MKTNHLPVSHTSENLATALKDVTDHWGITEKVDCATSDSVSHIKRAVKVNRWNQMACFAYTINLIVSASIESDPEVSDLVKKVKKVKNIVSFFLQNHQITYMLIKIV